MEWQENNSSGIRVMGLPLLPNKIRYLLAQFCTHWPTLQLERSKALVSIMRPKPEEAAWARSVLGVARTSGGGPT